MLVQHSFINDLRTHTLLGGQLHSKTRNVQRPPFEHACTQGYALSFFTEARLQFPYAGALLQLF